jgi:hypothetical protein
MTGLSRRRSRVRVPSLPLKDSPAKGAVSSLQGSSSRYVACPTSALNDDAYGRVAAGQIVHHCRFALACDL